MFQIRADNMMGVLVLVCGLPPVPFFLSVCLDDRLRCLIFLCSSLRNTCFFYTFLFSFELKIQIHTLTTLTTENNLRKLSKEVGRNRARE